MNFPVLLLALYLLIDYLSLGLSIVFPSLFNFAYLQLIIFVLVVWYFIKFYEIKYTYYLIILAALVLFSNNISSSISYVKNLLMLPLILYLYPINNKSSKAFTFTLVFLLIVISIFIELLITVFSFKDYFFYLGLDYYYKNRNIGYVGSIPIGFKYINSAGVSSYRSLGVFLSSDKISYLFSIPIYYFTHKLHLNNRLYLLLFFCVTSILGLFYLETKIVILGYLFYLINLILLTPRIKDSFIRLVFCNFFLLGIFLFVSLLVIPRKYLSSSGSIQHFNGLIEPFLNVNNSISLLFGNGLGSGGTLGRVFTDNGNLSKALVGGESFIGSTFYQLGLTGLLFLLFLYSNLYKHFKEIVFCDTVKNSINSILISILVCMTLSEVITSTAQSILISISIYLIIHDDKTIKIKTLL